MTTTEPVELNGEGFLIGPDGQRSKIYVRLEGEVVRGPLGRFVDLAAQIEEEGGVVPAPITELLDRLQQPQENET